jgi:site-specific recombinase XerD
MASLTRRVGRNGESVWYVVYNDAAGKQRWVRGYSDKRETQRLGNHLEDEKRKVLNGEVNVKEAARRTDRVRPVEEHLGEYKASLEAPGNTGNHIAYTLADIRKFFAHASLEHAEVVTRPHVDQWVMSLKAAGKDSMATINRRVGSLKAFLKALHQRGTLTEYVLYRYPKMKTLGVERRRRRALTLDEQRKLLKSAPSPRDDIYRFALLTGARHTQISSLTVGKVNLKSQTVVLQAKDNRHRNRE